MFVFNLLITLIIILILGFLTIKLKSRVNIEIRKEEILLTWFIGLVMIIIIRSIANIGLHYEISHQRGKTGLVGERGNRGIKGNSIDCK